MIARVPRTVRRAFTLAEMVVVVALIAILTVGIGRLFAGVSDAVGRGLAASELDSTARAIEEAIRRDFARVNLMQSEDTFLVIRAVELGGDPERPIYLTPEDRQADVLARIDPYDPGSTAIHTRLDEMAFLAAGNGADQFRSQQDDGFFTVTPPKADGARIYYGHGLRPRFDPDWPLPDPPPADANTDPLRQFVSDGWFGSRAGDDERSYLPGGRISGRNEYASDWVLARQALLLLGPQATGQRPDLYSSAPPYGYNREYAPYIRDLETLTRFWDQHLTDAPTGAEMFAWPGPVNPAVSFDTIPRPDPRLISHGRVDVCAQGLIGVKNWLEGESAVWDSAAGFSESAVPYASREGDRDSSAYGVSPSPSVRYDDFPRYDLSESDLRDANDAYSVQAWLWRRAADPDVSPNIDSSVTPFTVGSNGNPLDDLAYNYLGVRSAIAGVLTRPLVEPAPSTESREDPQSLTSPAERLRYAQEHDAAMDTHAVLAPRCSRFEIAWSDGSMWDRDVDFDGDGVFDVRAGDVVWFDPSRLDPTNEENNDVAQRMTYENLWSRYGYDPAGAVLSTEIRWNTAYTDPNALDLDDIRGPLGDHDGVELNLAPEVGFGDSTFFDTTSTFANAGVSPIGRRLWVKTADDITTDDGPSGVNLPYYNPDLSGGVPSDDAWPDSMPTGPSNDMSEYMAVWPFRVPTSFGEWGEAFEKNVWIRVRFTLHDPLGRIDEGRDYEVIVHLHPRDEHG